MRKKYTRKLKKGAAAPQTVSLQLDSSYDNAIENIRTDHPQTYNSIQNLRGIDATVENLPEIRNIIRVLRTRLYLSHQSQDPELSRLLDRIENVWHQLYRMSSPENIRGGKSKRRIKRKSRKNKTKRHK